MSHLRVISGSAKGRRLEMVPGEATRPVGDRVKEALFNILGPMVRGAAFLDLFAGTGSVAIEALSRGAEVAFLIDSSRRAIETIHKNLAITGLGGRAAVLQEDAFVYLRRGGNERFDFVYVAPPQYRELWIRAVSDLDRQPRILNPDAWVIAQIDPVEYEEYKLENLVEFDRREYGSTMLVFYEFVTR